MIVQSLKERIQIEATNGLTQAQIAKQLGCSKATVNYHFKKLGIESGANKTANDKQQQHDIQRAYAELKSTYRVAKLFAVSRSTVSRYINIEPVEKLTEEQLLVKRSQSVVEWRKRTKVKLVEYKGGKCSECGYDKSVNALQFHHLDPEQKDFSISGKSWSFEKLKAEVNKCALLCANCHAEVHEGILVLNNVIS